MLPGVISSSTNGIGSRQRAGLADDLGLRKIHIESLQKLFEQVLAMALEFGAIKLGRVSLDGTKLKANPSRHKSMSYGRMKEKQQQLKEEVKQLLEQPAPADEHEDRQYGGKRGDELPEELLR